MNLTEHLDRRDAIAREAPEVHRDGPFALMYETTDGTSGFRVLPELAAHIAQSDPTTSLLFSDVVRAAEALRVALANAENSSVQRWIGVVAVKRDHLSTALDALHNHLEGRE